MQRLLRGRVPYLVFGLLILLLYWREMRFGSAKPLELTESTPVSQPQGWWPEKLDTAALIQRLLQEPRLAMRVSILTVFTAGMLLGGFALTLWGLWSGRIRSVCRFPSRRLPAWSFGEFGRITLLTLMIASLLPFVRLAVLSYRYEWKLDAHLWMALSMLGLDCFVILVILTFATGKGRSAFRTLGFLVPRLSRSIGMGFRAYLAVFPWLFLLLLLIAEAARAFGWEPPIEPIHELIFEEQRPLVLALTFVLACGIGPLAEECFFRGVLYAALRQRTSRFVAMLTSGAVFALLHTNPVGFLPIMVLGCLLAYLYERTGSLASPLAIHIFHNTFLMALAMTFRQLTAPT